MASPKIRARTKKRAHINQKGGVGKTTWTLGLAAAAAHHFGARVLIRDMDPQGNASTTVDPEPGEYTMTDVLTPEKKTGEVVEGSLAGAIRKTGKRWPATLYVVTADITLANVETDNRADGTPRERRLQVASAGATEAFDLVVDDCPPSVGLLTLNALTDADEVEIITIPEGWAVGGCHQAFKTIQLVQKYHNPNLRFGGVWITRYLMAGKHPRREAKQRADELRTAPHFKGMIHEPPVTDIEGIRNAAGAHLPLHAYGPEAEEADAIFRAMADRVLND